ncbi:hypothetical protein HanHA300_Chr02g0057441 [Helianthus annuus]|nr:hypothetical protein HanHA300_Chr02g0057441 [Helianthus annuus]
MTYVETSKLQSFLIEPVCLVLMLPHLNQQMYPPTQQDFPRVTYIVISFLLVSL